MLTDSQRSFTDRLTGKFATESCLHIPLHLKYVATLPCEIWMSENWRQPEICIVIYDKSQESTAKHLRGGGHAARVELHAEHRSRCAVWKRACTTEKHPTRVNFPCRWPRTLTCDLDLQSWRRKDQDERAKYLGQRSFHWTFSHTHTHTVDLVRYTASSEAVG